ncbi:hypothetical protein E5K00_06240 [Hymenobacter aquaticus]|uniref:Uncharacterized protein n=1 Tax=Hymenobacter aquaticus TaxID=1867101 RepID=A0A4Z0Q437_9BACT|nr:hypothetical protein [Hymenobacter aquaticus]TGE24800.1 hypothetical protein E5K00_06240 [Hymenobacter aquaticus]
MTTTSNPAGIILNAAGWLFGVVAMAIGIINMFWGNDPGFGVFIFLLAFLFLPPVNAFLKKTTGFAIPQIAKWLLGFFILWASLGVGELFDKIHLMLASL